LNGTIAGEGSGIVAYRRLSVQGEGDGKAEEKYRGQDPHAHTMELSNFIRWDGPEPWHGPDGWRIRLS